MNSRESDDSRLHQLDSFIRHARDQEMSDEMIRHLLMSSGWKDKEICAGLASVALELPIPDSREKGGAREAFYHLSAFTCLYVSTVALLFFLFNLLDVTLPNAGGRVAGVGDWQYSTLRSSTSTLIVFFPLYLFFAWFIRREVRSGGMIAGGGVERWLTYLTLFVIVMTILIDAASLVYSLLEERVFLRVLLKALVLFAVMCGAFLYVWWGTRLWSAKTGNAAAHAPE